MTRTIPCGSCGARMRLSAQLLARVAGKTGWITCKACDARLRLDGRGPELTVWLDESSETSSAAAMLSRPSSGAPPAAASDPASPDYAPDSAQSHSAQLDAAQSDAAQFDAAQSDAAQSHSAQLSAALPDYALPLTRRLEALPLVSRREALPLVSRRPGSSPPSRAPDASLEPQRSTDGSLLPYVLDDDGDARTHLGTTDDSSPYGASLRDADVERRSAPSGSRGARSLGTSRASGALRSASATPRPPALVGRSPSRPPSPPRPGELSRRAPSSPSPGPFERFGLGAARLEGPIRLTSDGRLINASDRAAPPRRARIGLGPALLGATLFGLGVGAALARLGAPLELESLSGAREIELDEILDVPAAEPALELAAEAPAAGVGSPELGSPRVESARIDPTDAAAPDAAAALAPQGLAAAPLVRSPHALDARASGTTEARRAPAAPPSPAGREISPSAGEPSPGDGAGEPGVFELGPFEPARAQVALNEASVHAAGCRREGDPSGMARVVVTFAPSGRATSATLSGPPFAGTETGSCIAGRFRAVAVPAFAGEYVTVTKTVTIQ